MRKLTTLLVVALVATSIEVARAENLRLGYDRGGGVSLLYARYGFEGPTGSGQSGVLANVVALELRAGYSILGNRLFPDPDKSKFFIGDYIGAGVGLAYFKEGDAYVMIDMNFDLGVAASLQVNDDIELGVKVVALGGTVFTDLEESFALAYKPGVFPALRFKNLVGIVGYGVYPGGTIGDGNYLMLEGRLVLEFDAFESKMLFGKIERYSEEATDGSTETSYMISIGAGVM